jgi:hypothetical protein
VAATIAGVHENADPNSANRAHLIRLVGELDAGHRLTDADVSLVRQLIFHTVWLSGELKVAQEEIDRLNGSL